MAQVMKAKVTRSPDVLKGQSPRAWPGKGRLAMWIGKDTTADMWSYCAISCSTVTCRPRKADHDRRSLFFVFLRLARPLARSMSPQRRPRSSPLLAPVVTANSTSG